MAKVWVTIIHDETGRILSIARPAAGVQAVISNEFAQDTFETEVEEDSIDDLVTGSHRVDVGQQALVANE